MLTGETRDIRQRVALPTGEAFTIDATTVAVNDPDGLQVDSGTPAIVNDGQAEQFLVWPVTPISDGLYTVVFTANIGDQYLEFSQQVPVEAVTAPYSSIYTWIRSRLADSVEGLDDSEFDMDIRATIRRMLAPYAVDGVPKTYDGLSADDREFMDEAVGLLVAARTQVPLSTGGATSPLVLEKSETSTRQFAAIGNGTENLDERTRWEKEARYAFQQVSFVKLAREAVRAVSLFGLGGRRRKQGPARDEFEMAFGRIGVQGLGET